MSYFLSNGSNTHIPETQLMKVYLGAMESHRKVDGLMDFGDLPEEVFKSIICILSWRFKEESST